MADAASEALLAVVRAVSNHRQRDALFAAVGAALRGVVPFETLAVASHAGLAATTAHRAGARSHLALPLRAAGGHELASLVLMSHEPAGFDALDPWFVTQLAMVIGVGLESCLAYEEAAATAANLRRENDEMSAALAGPSLVVGGSDSFKRAIEDAALVAATDATVLVTGETGTGKELIARAIHSASHRATRPLVKVNCAVIPVALLESELFGHEPGAFTDATRRRIGRFEMADRGTLLLDEVGELPYDAQAKLLRMLQTGEFERVGGGETLHGDVRIIAATNRDLAAMVAEGTFRDDLYYRLSVFPITLAPLRERVADIAPLAKRFAAASARRHGRPLPEIDAATISTLERHRWPGNVRELENVMERAVIVSPPGRLSLEHAGLSTP